VFSQIQRSVDSRISSEIIQENLLFFRFPFVASLPGILFFTESRSHKKAPEETRNEGSSGVGGVRCGEF